MVRVGQEERIREVQFPLTFTLDPFSQMVTTGFVALIHQFRIRNKG